MRQILWFSFHHKCLLCSHRLLTMTRHWNFSLTYHPIESLCNTMWLMTCCNSWSDECSCFLISNTTSLYCRLYCRIGQHVSLTLSHKCVVLMCWTDVLLLILLFVASRVSHSHRPHISIWWLHQVLVCVCVCVVVICLLSFVVMGLDLQLLSCGISSNQLFNRVRCLFVCMCRDCFHFCVSLVSDSGQHWLLDKQTGRKMNTTVTWADRETEGGWDG